MSEDTKGFGRTTDGLMLLKNGDVVEFDLAVIQAAIDALPGDGKSFFAKNCLGEFGDGQGGYDCSKCDMPACPIADQ